MFLVSFAFSLCWVFIPQITLMVVFLVWTGCTFYAIHFKRGVFNED